ncbi:class I SAM-dependent methyltransferase [Candidatus Contubernalis alkaliaceticus]|uniref:class I SAM-dependent methyltransferase n=1 Tax=Candidatus Contubernalis alkaliaceticus TaxID=338645 RepID=UPI001F4C0AC9|nr:methyltransferase domain-containing protein [Candidatus Contubernalis alkalaceticus]UNC93442.1 methyltransferase domain-containing protein [Candidatus Contubernalis alkalaceticus]
MKEVKPVAVETREEIFSLSGRDVRLLVVKDIEALVTNPDDEDNIPYWADIWPASRIMASYIWEEMEFQGEEVLELGAGLGLPGIVAGLKGAEVTFSDYKQDALEITLINAENNGVKGAETYLGDWRDFRLDKKFDWILASDILYNPRLNPFAEKILLANLKEKGSLLVSHARRPSTYEALERLKHLGGFQEEVREVAITLEDEYYPNYMISLHRLQRKEKHV